MFSRWAPLKHFFYLAIATSLLFIAPPVSHAQATAVAGTSVVWNNSVPKTICTSRRRDDLCQTSGTITMYNVSQQVRYAVRVTDMATGNVINRNDVLPSGTVVKYEFLPHVSEDISWFAAAGFYDTPYGDWVAGAAQPAFTCSPKNYFGDINGASQHTPGYAALSVDPPVKTIANLPSGCTTAPDGASQICTLTEPGTVDAMFRFAPTTGKFYGGLMYPNKALKPVKCNGAEGAWGKLTWPMLEVSNSTNGKIDAQSTFSPYVMQVPEETISYPLTVSDDPNQKPPAKPTVTVIGANASACMVGVAQTISFTSTDPEGDSLRYLLDWNDDSATDQIVPASGYVPSGTAQSASRTFTTPGTKTVQVRAQDDKGTLSPWASISFDCAPNAAETASETTGSGQAGNGGFGTGSLGGFGNGAGVIDIQIRALPSLVRSGGTSVVTWSALGVTSCSVSAPNGDQWNTLSSMIGGNVTKPITERTVYTLACVGNNGTTATKHATINILPVWAEQ